MVDVEETLAPDVWVKAKSRLLSVIDPAAVTVEAYVDEADLERIAPGDGAVFFAEADSRIEVPLRVTEIARASTRQLADPALAWSMADRSRCARPSRTSGGAGGRPLSRR